MKLLLLIAILSAIASFFAVPVFECVFASLLVAPLIKYLLASILLVLKIEMAPGSFGDAALYLVSFAAVFAIVQSLFGRRRQPLQTSEFYPLGVFAVVYVIAHTLCMMWPDFITMGERLRDYSLLATSIDSPVVPREPWMEGIGLNYYVFWYRFGGLLNSLLYIQAWDAYHAIISFSLAFYAASIFQLVRVMLGGSTLLSTFMAFMLAFGSNIAGVMNWKRSETGPAFEPDNGWWGPSRVIRGAITEFPAWSFLLGDAHPHFLNIGTIPFFILILYRIVSSARDAGFRAIHAVAFAIGATIFLRGSNAWEVPMWLGVAAMVGLVAWILFRSEWAQELLLSTQQRFSLEGLRIALLAGVLVVGLAVAGQVYGKGNTLQAIFTAVFTLGFCLFLFPWDGKTGARFKALLSGRSTSFAVACWGVLYLAAYLSARHISGGDAGKPRLVRDPILFTSVGELFTHWGFHLFFISVATLLLFELSLPTLVMAAALAVPLVFEKAALFIYVLIGLQLVRLFTLKREEATWQTIFVEALAIASLGLLLVPEIVFLDDGYGGDNERMNTIFKVYTTDWALLGIVAAALSLRAYKRCKEGLQNVVAPLPITVVIVSCVVMALASTKLYAHTIPMRKQSGDGELRRSEGLLGPDREHPGSATIIRVLREKPKGRVLEAQGNPYSYTCFVSTLASQPSYLGWANHIGLLTKKHDEVGRRTKVTADIYEGTDCEARKRLAKEEGIRYIILGTLEKKKYQGVFDRDFSCLTLVVHDKDYWLFEVE